MRLLTTATDMRMSRPAAVRLPSSTTRTKIAMSSVSGIPPDYPGIIENVSIHSMKRDNRKNLMLAGWGPCSGIG